MCGPFLLRIHAHEHLHDFGRLGIGWLHRRVG
jgi:hypothetical protein